MVVDVIMVQRPLDCGQVKCSPKRDLARNLSLKEQYPCCWNYEQDEFVCDAKSEKIIERWVVQYESRKIRDINSRRRRSSNNNLSAVYKKSMLLLRSLHVTVRLLPAYKAYRDINSSGQIRPFAITYRVSSFSEPFTCSEEAEMQRFGFTPVDTASGRLCISVLYCSSLSDVSSELSTPMSPQLIPDYVGDSWSFDHYIATPPSVSFSPSPTCSKPQTSISNPGACCFQPTALPLYPPDSRSLPIFIPGSRPSKPHLQSESALASEPAAKLADFPAFSNKLNFTLRGTGSGSFKSGKTTGFNQPGTAVEKMKLDNILGVKVSSSSSSRSFSDDLDDTDFAYAFDMEYDDATDPSSRGALERLGLLNRGRPLFPFSRGLLLSNSNLLQISSTPFQNCFPKSQLPLFSLSHQIHIFSGNKHLEPTPPPFPSIMSRFIKLASTSRFPPSPIHHRRLFFLSARALADFIAATQRQFTFTAISIPDFPPSISISVSEGSAILELLAGEDEALLVRGDALIGLDLGLDIVDGVRGLSLSLSSL
ncbi:hypothetical protein C1H46_025198 [Malus baccata]|uniref:Autophagy-related protein 13 N-terminal domain-containing protein n=1 Tax=Malus baccata TaxID=106549 RepID=A0A540LS59_MALBA|nr:hypothetical protein C1H46_025198 [Malus baccata]